MANVNVSSEMLDIRNGLEMLLCCVDCRGDVSDDNECSRLKPCSHYCMNTPGSFSCSCPAGHYLSADGKICKGPTLCLQQLQRLQYVPLPVSRFCFLAANPLKKTALGNWYSDSHQYLRIDDVVYLFCFIINWFYNYLFTNILFTYFVYLF
jgi:hypothetical protein